MGAKEVFQVSITKAQNKNWVENKIWDINKQQSKRFRGYFKMFKHYAEVN